MSLQSDGGFMGGGFNGTTKHADAGVTLSVKPVTMEASSNSSAYEWGYEYYYGYLDPVAVDASELKYNRCEFVLCLK